MEFLFSGGEHFFLLEPMVIRLYLGAALCCIYIFFFFALDVCCWAIHVRRSYIYFVIYVSYFTAY